MKKGGSGAVDKKICPMMSKVVRVERGGVLVAHHLEKIVCLEEECAWWETWDVLNKDGVDREGWCILRNMRFLQYLKVQNDRMEEYLGGCELIGGDD